MRDPVSAMQRRLYDFQDCNPRNAKELRAALAFLPPSFVPWHIAVTGEAHRCIRHGVDYTIHRDIPPGAYFVMNEHYALASPEYIFVQMAHQLPRALLIKLGYELCGTYAPVKVEKGLPLQKKAPLANVRKIEEFIDNAPAMRGVTQARVAIKYVKDGSASARETDLSMTSSLPTFMGGYSFKGLELNYVVHFDEAAMRMAARAYAKCDLCWPDAKLDVEYDSELCHGTAQSIANDKARANALGHMGYRTIFVTNEQFTDMQTCDEIMRDIARLTGQRIRTRIGEIPPERYELHRELLQSCKHPVFATRDVSELSYQL